MTEAVLLDRVRSDAQACGLLTYHTHRSDRSEPGWPDLVLLGPGGMAIRELKAYGGTVSHPQRRWISGLTAVGVDVAVWWPQHYADGTVHRTLRRLARPQGGP